MLNVIIIEGNLTRDPELRRTNAGTAVANFTVACDEDIKRDGKAKTAFVRCTFFGQQAENVAKFFRKGRGIVVQGRLCCDTLEPREGQTEKRDLWYVAGTSFSFPLSDRKGDTPAPLPQAPTGLEAGPVEKALQDERVGVLDDDMPF